MFQTPSNKFFSALLLALILGFGLGYAGGWRSQADRVMKGEIFSSQEIADKAVNFLRDNFFSEGDTIETKAARDENNLYVLDMVLNGQEAEFYATKDGVLFFPQVLDMNPPADKEISKSEKPEVDLFVMSFCPYGNEAESQMQPIVEALGEGMDFNLHYIIYHYYNGEDYCLTDDLRYCSMHTKSEVNQDIRELCVAKYQPDKLWDFVLTINDRTDSDQVEADWEGIAQEVGLDIEQIKTCQTEEGTALLDQEMTLTELPYLVQSPKQHRDESGHYQTEMKVTGSPTLVVNGFIYDGVRSIAGYQEAICSAFNNPPAVCQEDLTGGNTTEIQSSCE